MFRASEGGLPRTASRVRALPPFTPEEERRHLATTLLGYARDLDGDGRAEIVLHRMVGELAKSRSSTTLHANAGGGADPLAAPFARLDRSGGNAALRLDDLDGDGRVEMLEAWVGFGVVQAVRMLTLRSAETTLRVLALPSAPGAEPLELWSADVTFPFDFATSDVLGQFRADTRSVYKTTSFDFLEK